MNKVMYALFTITILSGIVLSSSTVSADDDSVVDKVNVMVPVSCTLSGTGMNTHNATINNGQYNSTIGETTMKAYCNDSEGFAIYAIGYTDNTDGKNVLTNAELGSTYDIATGTQTTGDNSGWAMKLSTITSPEPTYPITIQNNFTSFQEVPDDYILVAKRESSTDIGTNAEGSTLKSTYQAYISSTQSAGTYTGQVKYVMMHPNYVDKSVIQGSVTVLFDGNGLTFPDGSTTNTVKYGYVCKPGDYVYVGNSYQEVMTSNILPGGTQNGSYTDSESILQTITLTGADKIKVIPTYNLTDGTGEMTIAEGVWGGYESGNPEDYVVIDSTTGSLQGQPIVFEGDTITVEISTWDNPVSGYDYGFYITVYPVYETEQPNTTGENIPSDDCMVQSISGSYTETAIWNGAWIGDTQLKSLLGMINPDQSDIVPAFGDEEFLLYHLNRGFLNASGSTITLYSSNPYHINYSGNNATAGTMDGFSTDMDIIDNTGSASLMAPNFQKTGYGFAGWSTDPNATIGSSSVIYGPNETITSDVLTFDDSTRATTLYAVWVPTSGNMQDWAGCSAMNSGEVTALTDIRDNNVYTVGKMQDGNCWMMENLRLESTNSDNSAGVLAQGYGMSTIYGNFSGLAESENTNFGSTNANSLYSGLPKGQFPRYNNNNTRLRDNSLDTSPYSNSDGGHYKWYSYGNYYTWAAAIADTELHDSGSVSTSICPKGWSLPVGTASGFSSLTSAIGENGSSRLVNYPNNFVYSGSWSNNGALERGYSGHYWSNTAYSTYCTSCVYELSVSFSPMGDMIPLVFNAYSQYIGGTRAILFGNSELGKGYSVRCLTSGT